MTSNLSDWLLRAAPRARTLGDALEWFIRAELADVVTDGVRDHHVVEDRRDRVRICGDVWTIDQSLHVFWLEARRASEAANTVEWTLFYDLVAPARRARNAVYLVDDPERERWRVRREGRSSIDA